MSLFWYALAGLGLYQGAQFTFEHNERGELFEATHRAAVASGKPALVVGMPRGPFEYPCSTGVTLDTDPQVLTDCPVGGVAADVRAIPYPAKHFGAALVSHVLEHLETIDDAALAWGELWRVADQVFIAYPRKTNLWAWMMLDHHLWVTPVSPQVLEVEERGGALRSGYVYPDGVIALKQQLMIGG